PGSWNRYAYVLDNPMNASDPTGRCGESASFIGPRTPCPPPKPPKPAQAKKPEGLLATIVRRGGDAKDYTTGELSLGTPSGLAGAVTITTSRAGKLYLGIGAGLGTPGVSVSGTQGTILTAKQPKAEDLDNFISGAGATLSGTGGAAGAITW